MSDQSSDSVTVTIDAEGDWLILDLPDSFVDLIREPDESVADLVPVLSKGDARAPVLQGAHRCA